MITDPRPPPGGVVVDGLWERFRVYHSRPRGLKDRIIRWERAVYEDLWALQDVSFELQPGETFAVMGANGSGKSTLLKCLARILPPDRGTVHIGTSKVASLLELGAGFQGDLSGRENIYLNGSILGLKRREIDPIIDSIIDFSGVREFIDSPVRNYSSGMYVRLGFAIAVHVDPDVLLVDEILAVGDAAFQTKCFEAMHDFKRRGKTMILVTHDLDTASRLCDRAILLDHGKVLADGPTRQTVDKYRQLVQEQSVGLQAAPEPAQVEAPPATRWGTGGGTILSVDLLDADDRPVTMIEAGEHATFRMRVRFNEDAEEPIFGLHLRADDGTDLYVTNTMWRGMGTGKFRTGGVAEVRFAHVHPLLPGRYRYTCAVAYEDATQWYEWWDDCLEFTVSGTTRDAGRIHLDSTITLTPLDPE